MSRKKLKLVIIESPFAGDVEANLKYARACMRDSILRGEAPIASHLLYTQEGILNDNDTVERKLGIDIGLEWGQYAELTAVYADLGISDGMKFGIDRAAADGRDITYRKIL